MYATLFFSVPPRWASGWLSAPGCREPWPHYLHVSPPLGLLNHREFTTSLHILSDPFWESSPCPYSHHPRLDPRCPFPPHTYRREVFSHVLPIDAGAEWYLLVLMCISLIIFGKIWHHHTCLIRFLCESLTFSLCPFFLGRFWEVLAYSRIKVGNHSLWAKSSPLHVFIGSQAKKGFYVFKSLNNRKGRTFCDMSTIIWNLNLPWLGHSH